MLKNDFKLQTQKKINWNNCKESGVYQTDLKLYGCHLNNNVGSDTQAVTAVTTALTFEIIGDTHLVSDTVSSP